jgi:hypothetical protein
MPLWVQFHYLKKKNKRDVKRIIQREKKKIV